MCVCVCVYVCVFVCMCVCVCVCLCVCVCVVELVLQKERELFQAATVAPVWQLKEDLQFRLPGALRPPDHTSNWEQVLIQVPPHPYLQASTDTGTSIPLLIQVPPHPYLHTPTDTGTSIPLLIQVPP